MDYDIIKNVFVRPAFFVEKFMVNIGILKGMEKSRGN